MKQDAEDRQAESRKAANLLWLLPYLLAGYLLLLVVVVVALNWAHHWPNWFDG